MKECAEDEGGDVRLSSVEAGLLLVVQYSQRVSRYQYLRYCTPASLKRKGREILLLLLILGQNGRDTSAYRYLPYLSKY